MTQSRDSKEAPKEASIERRQFLQHGTLAGAAALIGSTGSAPSQAQSSEGAEERPATTPVMTAEAEATPPQDVRVLGTNERSGSDFMVDVLKSLDLSLIHI